MLKQLREEVFEANLELVKRGVVIYTWGNVSGIDRDKGLMVIKPSGMNYAEMNPMDMVVVDVETGDVVEGKYKPSTDTPTHLELYRNFSDIGGIAHTHSTNAVAFAQAGLSIPALGTTHADYFHGDIPCTRNLTKDEVENAYELNTGKVIVETVKQFGYSSLEVPGIIVRNHGPFAWGKNPAQSVYHAVVMEVIAEMSIKSLMLNSECGMQEYILDRHYLRKHGSKAYYGQD